LLWLEQYTARIQALVDEATSESLTFAALQCRLAIEMVCYERLRNAHDYISSEDLKRWQPSYVINQLIQEVDPHVASSLTLSVSKHPMTSVDANPTRAEYEAEEYVEIGRQVGFDSKKLGRLWNALGSFLHVRMPLSQDDHVQFFGTPPDIKKKVIEALAELRELEAGTLISSGLGERVTFECDCGSKNARRAGLLKEGQIVSCFNPECPQQWTARVEDGEFHFDLRYMTVTCTECNAPADFPEKRLRALARNEMMQFECPKCQASNFLIWKLMHRRKGGQTTGDDD
jgi:Zn finger protein HypA/HybF involved in hydrogenase expression